MQPSAEVRWFDSEPLPEDLRLWFQRRCPMADENRRTDSYLVLPGSTVVGVKLREGRLEIKAQREPAREVRYPNGVAGRADGWIKLSLETSIESNGPSLVHVNKHRRLQCYSLDAGHPTLLAAGGHPSEGCFCELTALEVGDRKFWTLGLEAFGSAEHVDAILAATANYVFAPEVCPKPLQTEMSFAYPAWLLSLQTEGYS
jgi:hypothetical protein